MGKTKGAKNGTVGNGIDKRMFEEMCKCMCTHEEICSIFGVSQPTLDAWCKKTYGDTFLPISKTFYADTRFSLRRLQIRQAQKSVPMSIWLGKQYLGQTDKIDTNNDNKIEFVNDMPMDEEEENG